MSCEAQDLAQRVGDQQRLGLAQVYLAHYFWVIGHLSEGRQFALSARLLGDTRRDLTVQVGGNFHCATISFSGGDHQQANRYFNKVIELLPGDRGRDRCGLATYPAAAARSWFTWCLAEQGSFEEGITRGREGIRLAEGVGHAYSLSQAYWTLGVLYSLKGDFGEASGLTERSLTIAREKNVAVMVPAALWTMGHGYALSGRVAEGLPMLQEALNILETSGAELLFPLVQVHMAEALLLARREDEAFALARSGLRMARGRAHRGYEAWALRLLGEIASQHDPATGAAQYRLAMTLAGELGMRPLVAHCHLGLGNLYRCTGRRQQAQEYLSTATTMYRDMDMPFWRERAEAELRG